MIPDGGLFPSCTRKKKQHDERAVIEHNVTVALTSMVTVNQLESGYLVVTPITFPSGSDHVALFVQKLGDDKWFVSDLELASRRGATAELNHRGSVACDRWRSIRARIPGKPMSDARELACVIDEESLGTAILRIAQLVAESDLIRKY